ncbi:Cupredoxin [Cercophora newfieldiana]|uniref:Cupredoxin n=1 Tax=Cercophora newfieldiana TaxID=92897 RepID=A0AA39XRK0_9PEZI|nr:Cupredoxin [Cercophora newfieldiana]
MLSSNFQSLGLVALAGLTRAATVSYNFDITWVWAAPDGFGRPVVGVNNQWPCPTIEANVGDTLVVTLNNKLGNETTGIHWHGINQVSTEEMDGPSGVAQCPVAPGSSITYQFVVDVAGTYWYHSHNMGQYPDGLRGPLIVRDPNDPNKSKYDEEVIISVTDWYHNESLALVRNMLQPSNTKFQPPIPVGMLVNEGQGSHITFEAGKNYRIRLINFSAIANALIHFDSHKMKVIMNDAAMVKETDADMIRIAAAQRYDFIIQAGSKENSNYPFLISLDVNRDIHNPALGPLQWPFNYTGYLVMDSSKALDAVDVVQKWNPIDDSHFKAYDGAGPYENYDKLIKLDFQFCLDQNGYPRACFNNVTYIGQKVPTLYTAVSTGDDNTNPAIYGQVNPFVVDDGDVVQIVVNNLDVAAHPFHLHGHHFQVLSRADSQAGSWSGKDTGYASTPPKRDTVTVNGGSHAVLRFKADNPGVWLFHCHIEWHVEMGLTATIIEGPSKLKGFSIPDDFTNACKLQNIPYQGNAAGNTQNYTDTTGFITVPPTTYDGSMYVASSGSKVKRAGRFGVGMGEF